MHPPSGYGPIYLVKFTDRIHLPDDAHLDAYRLKLGTFSEYRLTEEATRRDPNEGQTGLDLQILRPSPALDELLGRFPWGQYDSSDVDDEGHFKAEHHFLDADHLSEFNAWIFCCSAIDDLGLLPSLQDRFEAESYYFITEVDGFANAIQQSLVSNLRIQPNTPAGQRRVRAPEGVSVFVDGWKDFVSKGYPLRYSKVTERGSWTYSPPCWS